MFESPICVMRNMGTNRLCCQFQRSFKHYKSDKLNEFISQYLGESACLERLKKDLKINKSYFLIINNTEYEFNSSDNLYND